MRGLRMISLLPGAALLAVLCAAQLMLIVDVVVVNIALPAIKAGLGVPDARLQLTSVAYTVTFGSLLIVAGRAGDLFGRRRLFLAGLAVFTVASLLAGAAQSEWQLFAARALQGLGAAAVSPNALALLTAAFAEGSDRNRALGVWGAVGSGGAIAGQVLGGLLTDLWGWRAVFLINLPVGVAVLALAVRLLPDTSVAARPRLDLAGALSLIAAIGSLTVALSRLAEHGAERGFVLATAASVAASLAFVVVERRHREPLVRFALLRDRLVRSGNLILVLNAGAVAGALYFTSLYLQGEVGFSPFATGLAFAPITAVVLVVSPVAGRLVGRAGAANLLLAGALLIGGGLLLLARVPADGGYVADVLPGLALIAFGSGLSYAPAFIAGTTGVADRDQGLASGLLNTSQELGSAFGLAVLGAVAAAAATPETTIAGYRAGFVAAAGFMALATLLALHAGRPWRGLVARCADRQAAGLQPDERAV